MEMCLGNGGSSYDEIACEQEVAVVDIVRHTDGEMVVDFVSCGRCDVDDGELCLVDEGVEHTLVTVILVDAIGVIQAQTESPTIGPKITFNVQMREEGGEAHALIAAINTFEIVFGLKEVGAGADVGAVQLGKTGGVIENRGGIVRLCGERVGLSGGATTLHGNFDSTTECRGNHT